MCWNNTHLTSSATRSRTNQEIGAGIALAASSACDYCVPQLVFSCSRSWRPATTRRRTYADIGDHIEREHEFGDVTVGTTRTSTLTLTNTGTGELTVTSVSVSKRLYGHVHERHYSGQRVAGNHGDIRTYRGAELTGNITVTGNQASGTNTIAVSGNGVAIPTFTLSGLVTETPPTTSTVISGVVVTFVDGANQGKTATTGADGRYQIPGLVNGGYTVSASKAGYTTVLLPVGINGNTTLDFRLAPTAPRTSFGPGQYRVGPDIPAGRYYSDPSRDCHFQRVRRSAARRRTRSSRRSSASMPASGSSICCRPTAAL